MYINGCEFLHIGLVFDKVSVKKGELIFEGFLFAANKSDQLLEEVEVGCNFFLCLLNAICVNNQVLISLLFIMIVLRPNFIYFLL